MQTQEMDQLIARHLEAEMAGDAAGAVAVYTEDVVHDAVGFPGGPISGRDNVRAFYESLVQEVQTKEMQLVRRYYGDNFAVLEHIWRGPVPGTFLGIPGRGRKIAFRLLHVLEFRDGRISRENVWMDGGAAVAQLTA
jgi:steroid delta-isomerase-like uncharacterized protein